MRFRLLKNHLEVECEYMFICKYSDNQQQMTDISRKFTNSWNQLTPSEKSFYDEYNISGSLIYEDGYEIPQEEFRDRWKARVIDKLYQVFQMHEEDPCVT